MYVLPQFIPSSFWGDAIIIPILHMEIGRCVILMLGSGEIVLKFTCFDPIAHNLPCFPSLKASPFLQGLLSRMLLELHF